MSFSMLLILLKIYLSQANYPDGQVYYQVDCDADDVSQWSWYGNIWGPPSSSTYCPGSGYQCFGLAGSGTGSNGRVTKTFSTVNLWDIWIAVDMNVVFDSTGDRCIIWFSFDGNNFLGKSEVDYKIGEATVVADLTSPYWDNADFTLRFAMSSTSTDDSCYFRNIRIGGKLITEAPTQSPTSHPTSIPTKKPSFPTNNPSRIPTSSPHTDPSTSPTLIPTLNPTTMTTGNPTLYPTWNPSGNPTVNPSNNPTGDPSGNPTRTPSNNPTVSPSNNPIGDPSNNPTVSPSNNPTVNPSNNPTVNPSSNPTVNPSANPTRNPSRDSITNPSMITTQKPSMAATATKYRSMIPTTDDIATTITDDLSVSIDNMDLMTIIAASVSVIAICGCILFCFCFLKKNKQLKTSRKELNTLKQVSFSPSGGNNMIVMQKMAVILDRSSGTSFDITTRSITSITNDDDVHINNIINNNNNNNNNYHNNINMEQLMVPSEIQLEGIIKVKNFGSNRSINSDDLYNDNHNDMNMNSNGITTKGNSKRALGGDILHETKTTVVGGVSV